MRNVRVLSAQTVLLRAIAGRSGIDCAAGAQLSAALFAILIKNKIDIVNTDKAIELEGTIMSVLPGTMFRVALANDHLVLAHISGKMRKRFIRLTIGDRVKMQMSPYDTAKARIVYRL